MINSAFSVALMGEVDAGKSTLLGQILLQTNSLRLNKILEAERTSLQMGKSFEPAFLLDAFEEERLQEMTMDSTSTHVFWSGQEFKFFDTPGHKELSNKFLGSSCFSDFALLVIDSSRPLGSEQLRHLHDLFFLQPRPFGIVINKISEADQNGFLEIKELLMHNLVEYQKWLKFILPSDAKTGLGISGSKSYRWADENISVLSSLEKSSREKFFSTHLSFRIYPHSSPHQGLLFLDSGRLNLNDNYSNGMDTICLKKLEPLTLDSGEEELFGPRIFTANWSPSSGSAKLFSPRFSRPEELTPLKSFEAATLAFFESKFAVDQLQFSGKILNCKSELISENKARIDLQENHFVIRSFYKDLIFLMRWQGSIKGLGRVL